LGLFRLRTIGLYSVIGNYSAISHLCRKEGRPVRKLAGVLGGLLVVGAPFGAHALASQKAAADTCVTVPVVGQTVCVPTSGLPSPPPAPGLPGVPSLPNPPSLPGPPSLPQLPAPPSVPTPPLPAPPSVPGLPGLPGAPPVPVPGASGAGLSSGCQFTSARTNPPAAGEVATTLPDGTVIYRYPATPDPNALSGYMGGTNSLGTLEGSGAAGPNGVTGQIGGHNNQTGADGYIGSNGACLNGNSLP
jgi:hypothetical protein